MRHRKLASILTVAAIWLSGCSGGNSETREYELPRSFCGVDLEKNLYEPIFPPGENIEVVEDYGNSGEYLDALQICDFSVDGTTVLSVDSRASSVSSNREIQPGIAAYLGYWAELHPLVEPPKIPDSELIDHDGREIRVWPNMAASFTPCSNSHPILDYTGINISVSVFWLDEDDDLSDVLTQLIEAYTEKRLDRIDPKACEMD